MLRKINDGYDRRVSVAVWIPDIKKIRDLYSASKEELKKTLPEEIDLNFVDFPKYSQGIINLSFFDKINSERKTNLIMLLFDHNIEKYVLEKRERDNIPYPKYFLTKFDENFNNYIRKQNHSFKGILEEQDGFIGDLYPSVEYVGDLSESSISDLVKGVFSNEGWKL